MKQMILRLIQEQQYRHKMGNILQDMMGLLSRKKVVKKTEPGDYLVLGRMQGPEGIYAYDPKMDNRLISLRDLRAEFDEGEVTGSGTTNYFTIYTDGPESVIGDSLMFQNDTGVSLINPPSSSFTAPVRNGIIEFVSDQPENFIGPGVIKFAATSDFSQPAASGINQLAWFENKFSGTSISGSSQFVAIQGRQQFTGSGPFSTASGGVFEARYRPDSGSSASTGGTLYGVTGTVKSNDPNSTGLSSQLDYQISNYARSEVTDNPNMVVNFAYGYYYDVAMQAGTITDHRAIVINVDNNNANAAHTDYTGIYHDVGPTNVGGTHRFILNKMNAPIETAGGLQFTNSLPAYADDADAAQGGLETGFLFQTDGTGNSPLNVPGIVMIKQ